MSSEEEADSHAPYSDKLLKKQKRARQRVDAGEPRNSYSTLATNGPAPARTTHMSGGLYSAIFEGRQHFGIFGTGYAPAEMLNELLGRTPKQEDTSDEPQPGDIAHRVLRDILQNRKKEFLGLSPDNNNVLANNNNDEPKEKRSPERPTSRDSRPDLDDALLALESAGESRTSPPPTQPPSEPLLNPKPEPEDRDSDAQRSSPRPLDPMKRARVENIVSTMRASPAPQQPQVNGCKKRKLYHPQQHDGAAERYGTSQGSSAQTISEDSDDEGEQPPIQQKLEEKNALRSQLRSMREQLAEMQEKYLELRNQMGQGSETIDNDGNSSDVEQTEERVPKSEPTSPAKEVLPPVPTTPAPNMLSQVMSKMMSAKMHPHGVGHPHLPHGPFNGALPMMPHLPHADHLHPPHPHQHLNNAAAMYLNVSQKLFLEQEARMKEAVEQQQNNQQLRPQSNQHSPQQRQGQASKPPMSTELAERLDALRSNAGSVGPVSGADLEGLADVLKNEITASLATLIDSIVTRFVHQRRILGKQSEAAAAAAEQLNKDLMRASRMLDKTSPTPKQPERQPGQISGNIPVHHAGAPNGVPSFITHNHMLMSQMNNGPRAPGGAVFQLHTAEAGGPGHNTHIRPPTGMFQAPPKPLASLYSSMNGHFEREPNPEQNEALSLVVTPKRKRHKVTDTRITPRTVSRILGEGVGQSPESKFPESPSPRPYPGGMALPTSVAIPNPSLHESQVFSPYSPFFGAGGGLARSPPAAPERESPPLPHAPALLHPALLAAAHHASPDYLRHHHAHAPHHAAKLMFFWVRYPSSAVLKMYFPDIKFNKNNTAQLVKWFSNFREFYYIQMEKYARQAISEGQKIAEDLHVAGDSELYRVLNLHYNRNNHIEVPPNFRYVVEQTLREFFRAIQGGKDTEQSWKKSIYKVISRLDDPVPEYFKSPNFLEQLE
ncbi:hypothetical protein K1T71_010924 [Dendrolimus kikuchii]|uniref:Uncharacterized protein n=1 Tax=Dendrolimus kikuchii TaxID=765133 RepID=A0ACC1CQC8_9NEOP|nr:hypothetical protein K1T71_010924 [Dendrolimus kikuchii]